MLADAFASAIFVPNCLVKFGYIIILVHFCVINNAKWI